MAALCVLPLGRRLWVLLGLLPAVARAQGEAVTETSMLPRTTTTTPTVPLCVRPEVLLFSFDWNRKRATFVFCGPIKLRPGKNLTLDKSSADGGATERILLPLTVASVENDVNLNVNVDVAFSAGTRFIFGLPADTVEDLEGNGCAPYTSPVYPKSLTYEQTNRESFDGRRREGAGAAATAADAEAAIDDSGDDEGQRAGTYAIIGAVTMVFCVMCCLMVYGSICRAKKTQDEVDEENVWKREQRRRAQKNAVTAFAEGASAESPSGKKKGAKEYIAQEIREEAFWSKLDTMQPPFRVLRLQAWGLHKKHQEVGLAVDKAATETGGPMPCPALPWDGAAGGGPESSAMKASSLPALAEEPANPSAALFQGRRVKAWGEGSEASTASTVEDPTWQSEELAAAAACAAAAPRGSGHSRSHSGMLRAAAQQPQRQHPVFTGEAHESPFAGTWPMRSATSPPSLAPQPEAPEEWCLSASGKFVLVRSDSAALQPRRQKTLFVSEGHMPALTPPPEADGEWVLGTGGKFVLVKE